MEEINVSDLLLLTKWDTPTICNALEVVAPERRSFGFTSDQFVPLDSSLPPMCGYAKTATIRAARPSDRTVPQNLETRLGYYEYIYRGQQPKIALIQDLDTKPGLGAFWGEVNTNIHKGLGCLGAVTNGSIRDLGDSAKNFNLLGGKIGPSHAFVHIVDFGHQIEVHGMTISENDILHADCHGAVIIPPEVVKELPDAIAKIEQRERRIISAAKKEDFTFEKLKAAIAGKLEVH